MIDMANESATTVRRATVTGGAGFIGSHLVDALVARGDHVTVIDDLSSGSRENIAAHGERVRFVHGSILDTRQLRDAIDGADVVFHEAALCSVPASIEKPREFCNVNTLGTLNVLEVARSVGVRRIVYAASSSAYGNQDALPVTESLVPDPISPYAATKLAGEHLLRAFSACYGLSCVSLRYFNVFGPRQRPDSPYAAVIPKFADALLSDGAVTPIIFGNGGQTRDFTYVGNIVHANLLAADCAATLKGDVMNIGCGDRRSVLELFNMIAGTLGKEAKAVHEPDRAGDVRHSMASIDRAHATIGYRPVVPFEEGLRLTLEWYVQDQARSPRSASQAR
jgi:nucleoside-diphosphate-sugar epimerase